MIERSPRPGHRTGPAVRPAARPTARSAAILVAGGLVLSACADSTGGDTTSGDTTSGDTTSGDTTSGDTTSGAAGVGGGSDLPAPLVLDVPSPNSVYDPVIAGEATPPGYRQLLARDAIEPVYDPSFTTAAGVDWPEESLVIGVDLNDEARAYPVGFLNRREIVNDDHRGIPTLVTW